jgi:hypothetical protein
MMISLTPQYISRETVKFEESLRTHNGIILVRVRASLLFLQNGEESLQWAGESRFQCQRKTRYDWWSKRGGSAGTISHGKGSL